MRKHKTLDEKRSILIVSGDEKNISELCRRFGISRTTYYRMKQTYQAKGDDGLKRKKRREMIGPEVESAILEFTKQHPTASYRYIARSLSGKTPGITEWAVRKVWSKHSIGNLQDRLARFEALEATGLNGSFEGQHQEVAAATSNSRGY